MRFCLAGDNLNKHMFEDHAGVEVIELKECLCKSRSLNNTHTHIYMYLNHERAKVPLELCYIPEETV